MKEQGFTLIELLAVIVILAIISLIATPIVLSIINESKENARLRSAEMYLDAVEQSIALEKMTNTGFNPNTCTITETGNLLCDDKDLVDIKVDGAKPEDGKITFENGKIKNVNLIYENDKIIVKNEDGNLVYEESVDDEDSSEGSGDTDDEESGNNDTENNENFLKTTSCVALATPKLSAPVSHTSTWQTKSWGTITDLYGSGFWTDGTNIYYSDDVYGKPITHYILRNGTLESITWKGYTDVYGSSIWTDGTNIYYSSYENQYVLDGDTWKPKVWNGLSNFGGSYIWTDGTNIYYSNDGTAHWFTEGNYILKGNTWEPMTWEGNNDVDGYNVWTDGKYIYNSKCNSRVHYRLNGNTWETITWKGLTNPCASYIWTDGINIYHSGENKNYILNGDTWEAKTWNFVSTDFYANFWTDGTNIYYSNYDSQDEFVNYILK